MSKPFVVRSRGGQNVSKYHPNPDDCWCLPAEESRRWVDAEHVERRDLEACRVCSGERTVSKTQRTSFRARVESGEVDR